MGLHMPEFDEQQVVELPKPRLSTCSRFLAGEIETWLIYHQGSIIIGLSQSAPSLAQVAKSAP
jgi:hypothetical protein